MNIIKSVENHIKSVKSMARLADRWAKVIARHGPFPRTPFLEWREIATEKVSHVEKTVWRTDAFVKHLQFVVCLADALRKEF